MKVAIVEKYPSGLDYLDIFQFKFDIYSLVDKKVNKVYKKDIDLDIDQIKEYYDYIILVGADPCKFIGGIKSVTEYQGYLVEGKYLPLVNPVAVRMKPSLKQDFEESINSITNIIEGNTIDKGELDLELISTEERAIEYLTDLLNNKQLKYISMDTETTGFYPRDGYVLGISISHKKKQGVYIDSICIDEVVVSLLQKLINKVTVVFHNAKFDIKMLQYHFGLNFPDWDDTMLMHYTLDETVGSHGLKTLALKFTNLGDYDKDLEVYKKTYCRQHKIKVSEFTYDLIPFGILGQYAAIDTAATIELYEIFSESLSASIKLSRVYKQLLKKGTSFLIAIEENGIPINIDKTKEFINEINNKDIPELLGFLYDFEEVHQLEKDQGKPFNVNAPAQKQKLFFDYLKLPVIKKTPTGNPSTDIEVIEELSKIHELPSVVNEIMKLKKVKSTYLDKFIQGVDNDGRLRTNFNLHTVTSGRLSSSGKLNAQQLPRKDKRPKNCIEARKGFKIVSQDLKTAEMYVAAVLSGDKVLQQIFIDGVDYHGAMAVNKFKLSCTPDEVASLHPDLRQSAKTISFEILYKLNYNEEALEKFKKLKRWLQEQERNIKRDKFIYSFFGRKRRLEDVASPNKQDAQHHVRSGINFLVQSVASDINLLAAIDMQEWIEKNNFQNDMIIFGLVHDSILAEVNDKVIDIYTSKLAEFTRKDRGGMSIPGCPIGLDLEIGQNYGDVKKQKKAA